MTEATAAPPARRDDIYLDRLARIGTWLAASETGQNDPPRAIAMAAALRLHYAEAMGLPPLAALELSVIKGRIVPSAQLLRALADEAGLRVVRVEASATSCTAAVIEKDTKREIGRSTFTIEQARAAGLVKPNGNWQTYPERMLWARASGYAVKDHAPRIALGMTFADEVEEVTGQPYDVDGEATESPVTPAEVLADVAASTEAAEAWAASHAAEHADETIDLEPYAGNLATDAQHERIAALVAELTELERQAGIDETDWSDWVDREGRTVSGAPLTRERARHVIDQAESIGRKLRELIIP